MGHPVLSEVLSDLNLQHGVWILVYHMIIKNRKDMINRHIIGEKRSDLGKNDITFIKNC